ncbi:MFS transporter [Thermoplasmatales archaeon AK]|nr:MFS transporter [Thermoplasmatales archaeon AK]
MADAQSPTQEKKFTRVNALQTYISLMTYTFDILSFVAISFVIVPVSHAIYPSKTVGISLLVTWGGFAAGSVTRPLGAAIIGPLYDKVGRKRGLYLSIAGSSLLTAAIAANPTYASVGIWAPTIFIALRLIGGIFIGALISGGLVFAPENLPERFRGLMTGFAEAGGSWAHVIGAAWLLMITAVFVGTAYFSVGWRVMFLVALLPLILIIPVLYKIPESQIYVKAKSKGKTQKGVYKTLFSRSTGMRNAFLIAVFSSIGLLGYDNLTENTFPTFLAEVNKVAPGNIATLVLIGAAFGVIGSIAGGAISQKTGRKPFAIGGGIILIVISVLFLYLGGLPGTDYYPILFAIAPFYFFASISKADLSVFLNEAFTTEVRSTAVGLNWNLGYGIAGVWPLITSAAIAVYGLKVYPMAQFIALAVLGIVYLIASVVSKETIGNISREEASMAS